MSTAILILLVGVFLVMFWQERTIEKDEAVWEALWDQCDKCPHRDSCIDQIPGPDGECRWIH